MIPLAASTSETLWWITLGAGLVVALLVWFLLEWLRRTVVQIDRTVNEIWMAGKQLAQNTQATHLLDTTRKRGRDVVEELEQHRD